MHFALAALPGLLPSGPESGPRLAAGGPDLTRYLFLCGALVLAVGLLGFLVQRFLGGAWRVRAARRSLRVVDSLSLGGRQRVAVVACYDRTFVLGVGEREVSLVAELDAETVHASESAEPAESSVPPPRIGKNEFERLLRALPRRRSAENGRGGRRARLGRGEGVVG